MLNLSSLFYSTIEPTTLLTNITLSPEWRTYIAGAKDAARAQLRSGLPQIMRELGHPNAVVTPRFFTQGSWAYKTLNAPARPEQQADIDDGAYLPLSFMTVAPKPSVASTVFFAAAEAALKPLVSKNNWKLITDKDTCIRIEIAPSAHIDVPLYAIPDKQFAQLTEAALAKHNFKSIEDAVSKAERDAWTALPRDQVLLAHRKEDWVKSDPRPIKLWFLGEVDRHGEQFRRCVRYLKSFRDWQWVKGGPASILLMAAAAPAFERRDSRDDIALLDLVEAMQSILPDGVVCPTDPSESLTDKLGAQGVADTIIRLEQLEQYLRASIHATEPAQACEWIRQQFGPRFPNLPGRIKTVTATATILATPAAVVASPLVGRTQAG